MQDQVDALRQLGVRAEFLNSSLLPAQQRDVEARTRAGEIDLLYVAPERLMTERFLELLDASTVALFAIDEAHCVSQWGHDFRPEYTQLSVISERYPGVPRLALTATADPVTRDDIVRQLRIPSARVFVESFDRPNIRYTVVERASEREQLRAFLRDRDGEAGIVYCATRAKVDQTADWLRADGFDAIAYHAGLPDETRRAHHQRFVRDDGVVVVATIAFGMGIDKPDVRFVVPSRPAAERRGLLPGDRPRGPRR